jgi:hypothetical protein
MNKLSFLCVFIVISPMAACTGMSPEDNQRLRAEIDARVSSGMLLTDAEGRFADDGFSCDKRSSAPNISCTRIKQNALTSCVQRVNLTPDSETQFVAAVAVAPIACTSL